MYTKGKPLLPTTLQLFTPHLLHSVTFRHSWGWKCIEKPKNTTQFLCFCVSIFNSICDHDFPTINSTFYFLVCCSLLLFSSNAMKPFFAVRSGFHGILPKFLLKAFCKRYQGSCQNMALMRSVTSKGVFFYQEMVGEAIYYVDNNGRGVYFMIIVVKRFTVRKDVSLSTYYPLQNVFYLPNYVVRRTVIYHFRICASKRVVQSAFCFWYECFQKFWNNCVSLICSY